MHSNLARSSAEGTQLVEPKSIVIKEDKDTQRDDTLSLKSRQFKQQEDISLSYIYQG